MMRVLIIGFGSAGRRHYDTFRGFDFVESIDVVTNQLLSDVKTHHSLLNIEDMDKFDYFVIANETYKHLETFTFIDKQVKGKKIFCEKPAFDKYYEMPVVNNYVVIGYILRYHPLFKTLKDVLEDQRVLAVNVFCGSYLPRWRKNIDYRTCYSADKDKGGGVLLDLSHEIDYVSWLFGSILSTFHF